MINLRRYLKCLATCLFIVISGYSQTLPEHFAPQLVTGGLKHPVAMAFAPDGRVFVVEHGGKIRVIKDDVLLETAFATLEVQVYLESGLVGIAVDPDFEDNQYLYVYYTVPGASLHNRVSRFTCSGDVALENSEQIILELDPLSGAGIHNGGSLSFGIDQKLYISTGDNGVPGSAISLDSYHGKIIRVNPDGSIPEGNPFTGGSEQRRRVWAYGLRNPFTFSIQPGQGKIYINDVGNSLWEEINDATDGGRDFGWPGAEGLSSDPTLVNPIYTYGHTGNESGCAITGGTFFNPGSTNYPPEYYGRYFFIDFCVGWISTLHDSGGSIVRQAFGTGFTTPICMATGIDGNIYFFHWEKGELYRIIFVESTAPFIVNHPQSQTVGQEREVAFAVTSIGSGPLSYQWQKNGVDIENATGPSFSILHATFDHQGDYSVTVSNAIGTVASKVASLTVIPNPPVASITTPKPNTNYVAGTQVSFSGEGLDVEDGSLPESAFSWQINFHHDDHKHDQPAITGVKNGVFEFPVQGETSANVWYQIILTVTDSDGLTDMDSVDIAPLKSILHLETIPEGLTLTLDGQPISTPVSITSVEGLYRTIGVLDPLEKDNSIFTFDFWEHGGEASQVIVTPANDTTFIAHFTTNPIILSTSGTAVESQPHLYPNPVKNDTPVLHIYSESAGKALISLGGIALNDVVLVEKDLKQGNNICPLDVSSLNNGFYIVTIKMENKVSVLKLVIAR